MEFHSEPHREVPLGVQILNYCPTIFGGQSFPIIMLLVVACIFSFVSGTDLVFQLGQKKRKRSFSRQAFGVCVFLYCLYHCVLLVVPFPYSHFTSSFFCSQIRRNLLYISWQFLALRLLKAVAPTSHNRLFHRVLPILFFVIVVILFVISLVCSLLGKSIVREGQSPDQLVSLASALFHILMSVSILLYTIRLIYLAKKLRNIMKLKNKIAILVVILLLLFLLFVTRSVHNILTIFKANPMNRLNIKWMRECYKGKSCLAATLYFFSFYFIFDYLPVLLFLCLILFPISPSSRKKKSKTKERQITETSNLGKPALTFYSDSDDYTDVSDAFPSPQINSTVEQYYVGGPSGQVTGYQNQNVWHG
ncbi:hypothetical protein BLNAU_14021 [Blattamonas nauphoetae]|uniref:G-protein coupled receptors family 1 profile domain-containing protein n=1 Tax=Blattamonas nauphoetae TaxID=2049346 RepID=A0ABQ9XIM7_9EUKA|nr:hypothetical protein BLNAU_14021 [Blattamonas nauphoetae]